VNSRPRREQDHVTNRFLVTPENWFNLPPLAASTGADAPSEITLTSTDGCCPLAAVSLDELQALHATFGSWWSVLGSDNRPASLKAGEYDRFLGESRTLLRRQAEAALVSSGASAVECLVRFPDPGHPLLAVSSNALGLLRNFLALSHSPSLVAWARERAADEKAVELCRAQAWRRLLLQKLALEDEMPDALACLRSVYAGTESAREELLSVESQLLEQCDLTGLKAWARALGLDRSSRTEPAFDPPVRRPFSAAQREPDITVLVPSYCHASFIEAALESVLAQTYPGFRLLVVDDRSSDCTVAHAMRIDDPRLHIRINETNLGLGDSVLHALEAIATPYVALLNSDDLFHPERLERCRDALERLPRAQVAATDIVPIDAHGHRVTSANVRRLLDGRDIADWIQWFSDTCRVRQGADLVSELMERNFLITSSNIVCRTEFLRRSSSSLRGLKYCLDWQLFLEAATDGALLHLPEELLGYRLHGSNTVWFDEDRRAAYSVEVNRVLAHTLHRLLRSSAPGEDARSVAEILELLVNHAAGHSEANGLSLFSLELLGAGSLDDARIHSKAVRDYLRLMPPSTATSASGATAERLETVARASRAIAAVAREEASVARASERWAREELHAEQQRAKADRQVAEARWRQIEGDLVRQIRRVESSAFAEAKAHAEEVARLHSSAVAKAKAHAEEIARLHSSQEWLVGDGLWNKAGLSRIGRPVSRTGRVIVDRRNRWGLALGRAARRAGLTRPRAVVAACWSFPYHSHTYVYEEMQALNWMGFDCRVFCCRTNPKSELHPAFEKLWRNRIVLQAEWTLNQRDLDYFVRTRPERVRALLARVGQETGLSTDALLQQSIVMMGFTFARYVELAGADYLHTYFFYDQSFLALMAAYLLGIPRGVTAYADHMMNDYAFKCVPLHLELADIVVATSRRIKSELSAIGGGRFDGKIIVKPNGIDTARFPCVDTATRLGGDGEPELIAVNRIEPKKGLIHLVEALDILNARGVPARLNIVGGMDPNTPSSAECFRELTAKIDALQLSNRVMLHGVKKQPEFVPLLARSRIFVAPYLEVASGDKDGIPTAVLEAMSSGLPVVATDAGSIVEAITDGVQGVCVPQRDPARLADAIERLLKDPSEYARMSEAARHRAVSEFDVHVTERRLHERIRLCLNRQTGGAVRSS
jgi:glycosyltransferase involved in cell wall biosynthesis